MTDAPTPAPDADPLQSPDAPGVSPDAPGVDDATASADPLVAGMRAVRDAKPAPDASEIAADDVGATAMAQALGDSKRKG